MSDEGRRSVDPKGMVLGALLGIAATAAVVQALRATALTRMLSMAAAIILGAVGAACLRARGWAVGSAFFLGLFWLWAAAALGVQGRLGGLGVAGWMAWSIIVMVLSVRVRRDEGS